MRSPPASGRRWKPVVVGSREHEEEVDTRLRKRHEEDETESMRSLATSLAASS